MLIPATTMTAPRTACGRYCTGSVRKSRITTTAPAANRPAIWVRAPIASFTAVRAPLAPTENALREAGRRVRCAHRQQLLRRAHVLAALAGEGARGQDLVREGDEEERRAPPAASSRTSCERAASAASGGAGRPRPGRRSRCRGLRSRTPTRRPIAATTTISAPGTIGRKRRRPNSAPSETTLTASVAPLTSPSSLHHLPEPAQRLARVDLEPEQLAQLGDHERDRDSVQVADQHRPGEVVGDPAEPQRARQQEAGGDEQGEHRRQLDRVVAARGRERKNRGGDERRRRALRADDEPARRAEQDVGDRRQQQRVQAVDRREPGELAVGHRRRQRERRDRQPGDEVAAGARTPVARHVLGDRDRAHEQRLLLRRPERRRCPVGGRAVRRGWSGLLVVGGHGRLGHPARAA